MFTLKGRAVTPPDRAERLLLIVHLGHPVHLHRRVDLSGAHKSPALASFRSVDFELHYPRMHSEANVYYLFRN